MTKVLEGKEISYGVIKGVDFSIRQGEAIALMGANGTGKSTLARIMAGLIEPASGRVYLTKADQEIDWAEVRWWQEVGIIGQHPRRQTIGATVGEELGFGLLNLGYGVSKVQAMVKELAGELGMEGKLHQSPGTLSGGERQRLVLGAVLGLNPAFLVLDEALSMLDNRAQEACLKLLEEKGKAMGQLWITHDLKLAEKADRIWVVKDGKLLDLGTPEKAFGDNAFSDEFIGPFVHDRIGKQYRRVQNLRYPERILNEIVVDEEKHLFKEVRDSILEWEETKYGLRLSLAEKIKGKNFLAILGPSGAGKSTILESAIALIHPSQGRFLAFGQEVTGKSTHLRQRTSLLLQEPGEYIIGSTVYDEVFYLQDKKEKNAKRYLNQEYLEVFGIPQTKAGAYPEYLSGGERQRVALAAVLESVPEILLLDEPLLGIDAQGRGMFFDLLKELKGLMTILYVTHDWAEVRELADEVWLVEEGRITLKGQKKAGYMDVDLERLKEAGVRC